jgi:hypothetical protein
MDLRDSALEEVEKTGGVENAIFPGDEAEPWAL